MSVKVVENMVNIPEDVQFKLEGLNLSVTGPKGKIEKDFAHTKLKLTHEGQKIRIWAENPRKREAALVGTITAHINNMIKGVTKGFTYKMKIVFVHFPLTIKVQGKEVYIENFVGEKKSRSVNIIGDTQVSIRQDDVIVEGINVDDVSQTAANIQTKAKVRNKDLRKFLDGVFVYSKE
nr:50S ribosomal protein L6P, large subunit ribosomal protein L6 [uncultured archaeon]